MTQRWKIFTAFALMYVLAYFYRVSMAVMAKDLAAELVLSAVRLGTLSGAFFYAFGFTQLPLGPLLDRFGGKRTVLATGVATTCGAVLFALAHSWPLLLAGRVLIGIGSASVLMGTLRVLSNWFDSHEFGRISGFMVAVGNLGNLSATVPLAWGVARIGWRASYLVVAALQLLCLFLLKWFVQERPDTSPAPESPHGVSPFAGFGRVVSTPAYWLISLLAYFWYATYMSLQGLWGGPYLMEAVGLSREGAGTVLLAVSLGFLTGCLFVGAAAERLFRSRKRTIIAGQCLLLACMSIFLGPAERMPQPLLIACSFLIGVAVSSGVSIYPLVRDLFPHAIIGTALTAVNFFILLGAATMQQVMGWYIGRFPHSATGYPAAAYHGAFLFPMGGLAAATLFFLFLREPPLPKR